MISANSPAFTCTVCHAPRADYELITGRCHACTAVEAEHLRAALASIRDSVLHQRHQLEGYEVDSDIINAILGIIDDATDSAMSPASL